VSDHRTREEQPAPAHEAAPRALAGLRVLELGEGVIPAFCGRWLAGFGAAVVKVEPPGGDWTRRYHLDPAEAAWYGPDMSALFAYLNAGKELVTLDLETTAGRARLKGLLEVVDVLVLNLAPERVQELGLDLPALRARRPGLVEVDVSPFGEDGPYAAYTATSVVLLALSGYQYLTGEPGRPPLALPGFQPEYLTALYAVVAALAGVVRRLREGRGGRIELTALEAVASLHQFTVSLYLSQGVIRSRHGSRWENLYPITLLPCRDGYLGFAITLQDQWQRLCAMIGRPDLVDDPRFATPEARRAHADELDAILIDWLKDQDKMAVFHRAQAEWRLPVGPLYTLAEVLADPQYAARDFWVRPEGPEGPLHPGLPVTMSRTPWAIGPVPRGSSAPAAPAARQPQPPASPTRAQDEPGVLPLAGVRVLDFTRVWSGPLCTRILADLGAEVIKIEAPLSPELAAMRGVGYAKLNRNKLGMAIDLRREEGRELVRRLAARSDVLVENFSARVMPNFGLDYETLRRINPGLIMLSMPGFGARGPYRDYMSYGPAIEPMTGLTGLLGYPGEGPLATAIAYPDAVAGVTAAAAVLTALVHQRRTGEGQYLDLSQLEATTCLLGEFLIATQLAGRQPERRGNAHPLWAPHGTYRCRGEDEWVSIAVRSDDEWRRLCDLAGQAELRDDPSLATAAGRRAHQARIDAALETWTCTWDKVTVTDLLQRHGIPAGAVLNAKELLADPHLAHRGFFVEAVGENGRRSLMPGTPLRVDGQPRREWRDAPAHGEHNRHVLRTVLGMSDAEIAALEASGVLAAAAPVGD
jgi:crotonobetainyl-CoA:carnitine CoA-transferase CaiB-like acyl-CoA transferase